MAAQRSLLTPLPLLPLLPLVLSVLAAARANVPQCVYASGSGPGPSSMEADDRAERRFPGWKTCGVNPWEMSGKFEGDLLVSDHNQLRQALRDTSSIWPNKTVPYRLHELYFHKKEQARIRHSIREFNKLTCVRFRRAEPADKDYVTIYGKIEGCYTEVGRKGGAQEMNLEPPVCALKKGCVFHQLMHVLGFAHEHNAPDRDNHVTIIWGNIREGKEDYFKKLSGEDVTDYGIPYDYASIMHGGRKAHSRNTSDTIDTKASAVAAVPGASHWLTFGGSPRVDWQGNECDGVTSGTHVCNYNCTKVLMCRGDGEDAIELSTCTDPFGCVQGQCVNGSSSCEQSQTPITCTGRGLFPDPYDCTKYHICKGEAEESVPQICEHGWAYDPLTAVCSKRTTDSICTEELPIVCTELGESKVFPENPSIYYVCVSDETGGLFPTLYRCKHGMHFNPETISCDDPTSSW